jgi:hypothetical protein
MSLLTPKPSIFIHGPHLSKYSPLEVINFPTPSLGVVSTLVLLGFNQATSSTQCFLESTKPLATPMFLGFNQVTGLTQCSLESTKSSAYPSAPWNQPSHWPPQCSLDSTKSPATQVLLGFNQVTGHPSVPWIQPSHRPPQCSVDSTKSPVSWSCSTPLYTSAM